MKRDDIDRELAGHLDLAADELVRAGVAPDEARRRARLALGGLTQTADAVRDVRASWADAFRNDVRYAVRQLRATPAFTLVAILSLAIGTGANITIFGFASALLLKPLEARDPGQLIRVMGEGGDTALALQTFSDAHIRAQDYFHYRDENQTFTALAAHFIGGPMPVRVDGPARMIPLMLVSGNFFETLGVHAYLGRTLTPADGKTAFPEAVVLSDAGWRRFFDADPKIVGRTAFIEGRPATIVGILPGGFVGANAPMVPQMYAPIAEVPKTAYRVDLVGRLKAGVSRAQAAGDLTRIARRLTAVDRQARTIETFEPTLLMPGGARGIGLTSSMFFLVVLAVLLIACDNIAILLLTRSARRRQEIGVRLALGASRPRLLMQLLVESLVLCTAGGLAGLYLAHVTAKFLTQFYVPVPMPFALTYDLDWRVVVFAMAVSCAAAVLCGLAPAMQSLKIDVVSSLRTSGTAVESRVRSTLIVTQMALSAMLLVVAALLTRSLVNPISQNSGFSSRGVLLTTIAMDSRYTAAKRAASLRELVDSIGRAPGIDSVSAVDNIPLANNKEPLRSEMHANGHAETVSSNAVAPAFFRTLGIALLAGRDFTGRDDPASADVGIVNETLARRFWPGGSAVGQRLERADGKAVQIIGVVRDAKYESPTEPPLSFLYRPQAQTDVAVPTILVKASADSASVLAMIKSRVVDLDPDLAPFNMMTFDDRLNLGRIVNRAGATVSISLGIVALLLSVIGIYGTMAFIGQQRRREIGVRVALGASMSDVIALMTRQGMQWAGMGLAVGVTVAIAAGFLMRALLHGVVLADPWALLAPPLILGSAAFVACFV
ncbi:MAG TPA: ABC transporter permease, partial [Vicinamibacterales bacterium]|nr:ABC transporter permease [Vicinamibacterales bacterium]